MMYDAQHEASAWMMDFAKTLPVEKGQVLNQRTPWQVENQEDGYLFGLDNLISVSMCNSVDFMLQVNFPQLSAPVKFPPLAAIIRANKRYSPACLRQVTNRANEHEFTHTKVAFSQRLPLAKTGCIHYQCIGLQSAVINCNGLNFIQKPMMPCIGLP